MLHKTAASAIFVYCNVVSALSVIMHSLQYETVPYTNYGTGGTFELSTRVVHIIIWHLINVTSVSCGVMMRCSIVNKKL